MQIKVRSLREALELLGPVVPKKATLPVLINVLLKDGQAIATDLEVAVAVELPDVEGQCLIPYCSVADLLKRVPGAETLTIEQEGGKLNLTWSSGKASYEVPDPEDYPPLPQVSGLPEQTIEQTVDGDDLVSALLSVVDYCSTKEDRPVLNGVALLLMENVQVASADGFRLALKTLPLALPAAEGLGEVIIPAKAVRVLGHLWDKTPRVAPLDSSLVRVITAKKQLELTLSSQMLKVRFGAVTLTTMLIQGTPPKYRQLIPEDTPLKVRVFAPDLERAVRRVQAVARKSRGGVRLTWSEDMMTVSSRSDKKSAEAVVAVATEGGDGRVALDVDYLLGYLQGKEGLVEMGVTDTHSPVFFRHGSSPLVLIMPLLVEWEPKSAVVAEAEQVAEQAQDETEAEEKPKRGRKKRNS